MPDELNTLMEKISVLTAENSQAEVSLSYAEAMKAGLFTEDALSADDAADSFFTGEASHG